MKKRIIEAIPAFVIGLFVAFGTKTIFPVCPVEEDKIMKCHWTSQAELGIGLLIVVLALLHLFFRSGETRLGLKIGVVLNGILGILIPTALIGVCSSNMTECQCHALAQPALIILNSLLALIYVIWIAVDLAGAKKSK